jgi:hypothetical protein
MLHVVVLFIALQCMLDKLQRSVISVHVYLLYAINARKHMEHNYSDISYRSSKNGEQKK